MKKIIISCILTLFTTFMIFGEKKSEYKKFDGWKKAETEHFTFIFEEESRLAAQQYALLADDAWNNIARIYGFPQDKTNVYVYGRTNTVNAYTYFSPVEITMFNTPVVTPDFGFREDWMKLFFTHELIHVSNIRFEDKSYLLSSLFGNFMNTIQFMDVPNYSTEGLATLLEGELTDGGRGRSPFFELMYKAPTLDNCFISYDEIGMEKEPPRGQAYVMGYLILRSIADRWGISALADIERNRSFTCSWEQSVKLVTGETPQNIYKDVRIALAKKYAGERSIPEGIFISPRDTNTSYFNPAIILDDGNIITLRSKKDSTAAVVKYNPAMAEGSAYLGETFPEKDLNTVPSETILFTGNFADSTSVTADENENVYAAMAVIESDKLPGPQIEYQLYKWNAEDGLNPLVKDTTLYQPSVSRNGKTLVAVKQEGLNMTLVQVDTTTGALKTLLADSELSFIQPAVNADGTKLAFLVLTGKRAQVAVADLTLDTITYEIVGNNQEQIYDPSYPNWNSNGNLTYTCNYRDRLEVFEVVENETKPVVADPIAALWAYSTNRGIYYASYASSGYVIKMKPLSEWGVVPEEKGPSAAGKIICFGHLENDFPEFKPYEKPSEVELTKEEYEELNKPKTAKEKNKDNSNEPTPIKGKYIEHRSEEKIAEAEKAVAVKTVLENEKNYFPMIQPIFYMPIPGIVNTNDNSYFGIGYTVVGLTPKLQMNTGLFGVDVIYFPKIKNFTCELLTSIPVGNTFFDLAMFREFYSSKSYNFAETNDFLFGITKPFYTKSNPKKDIDFAFISSIDFALNRYADKAFGVNYKGSYKKSLQLQAGIDSIYQTKNNLDQVTSIGGTVLAIGLWDFTYNKPFAGVEFEGVYSLERTGMNYEIDLRGRYADFPEATSLSMTRVRFGGKKVGFEYPGVLIPQVNMILPDFFGFDLKLFGELMFTFGKNTVDYEVPEDFKMFALQDKLSLGTEMCLNLGRQELGAGYSFIFDLATKEYLESNFYLNIKYSWLRF